MEEVVPMDKNEWFYVWSKKEKILVFLAEKKVLQKFYKNSKNLEFFQKKCFFVFFDVFSHFEVKNEVPEHLRWLFEVFWDIFLNEYTTEAFNRRLWSFNHFLEFMTNSNTGVVPEEREAIRRKNDDNK